MDTSLTKASNLPLFLLSSFTDSIETESRKKSQHGTKLVSFDEQKCFCHCLKYTKDESKLAEHEYDYAKAEGGEEQAVLR